MTSEIPTKATAPREGLPPCQTQCAQFEGRNVSFYDSSLCGEHEGQPRYAVSAGVTLSQGRDHLHPKWAGGTYKGAPLIYLLTDDPDEAQAAFERGREYVRTGRLP
jgi:hypothetical protein